MKGIICARNTLTSLCIGVGSVCASVWAGQSLYLSFLVPWDSKVVLSNSQIMTRLFKIFRLIWLVFVLHSQIHYIFTQPPFKRVCIDTITCRLGTRNGVEKVIKRYKKHSHACKLIFLCSNYEIAYT